MGIPRNYYKYFCVIIPLLFAVAVAVFFFTQGSPAHVALTNALILGVVMSVIACIIITLNKS